MSMVLRYISFSHWLPNMVWAHSRERTSTHDATFKENLPRARTHESGCTDQLLVTVVIKHVETTTSWRALAVDHCGARRVILLSRHKSCTGVSHRWPLGRRASHN